MSGNNLRRLEARSTEEQIEGLTAEPRRPSRKPTIEAIDREPRSVFIRCDEATELARETKRRGRTRSAVTGTNRSSLAARF